MSKNRTPIQRLKGQINNFSENLEHIATVTHLQTRSSIEKHYRDSARQSIGCDFVKIFTFETSEWFNNFNIHYFFLDKDNRTIPENLQSIEVSFENEKQHLHSHSYSIEEFRELMKEVNAFIKTIHRANKIEEAEEVLDYLIQKFNLGHLPDSMDAFKVHCQTDFENELYNLGISRKEEQELTKKRYEREKKVEDLLYRSDEAKEIAELEKQLRLKRQSLKEKANVLHKQLCIDEVVKLQEKTETAKQIIMNDVEEKMMILNKEYHLPKIEFDIILNDILETNNE